MKGQSWGKALTKRKKRPFRRLDEIACSEWRPLTLNELRQLAPIKLKKGRIDIDRRLLALLLGERDRLIYVAEAARWIFKCMKDDSVIPRPDYMNPTKLEKAASVLQISLDALEHDGLGQRVGEVTDLAEEEVVALTQSVEDNDFEGDNDDFL